MEILNWANALFTGFLILDVLQFVLLGILLEEIIFNYRSKKIPAGTLLTILTIYSDSRIIKFWVNLFLLFLIAGQSWELFWQNNTYIWQSLFIIFLTVIWLFLRRVIIKKLNIKRTERELNTFYSPMEEE